jgi:LysM repeat protein
MNTKFRTPLLMGALAVVLILAACDRPSAGTGLTNPPTTSALDVSGQPTPDAPIVRAQETADAAGNAVTQPDTSATAAPTAIPPQQPNATEAPEPTAMPDQPTSEPVVVVQSTPAPDTTQSGCSSPYTVKTGEWLFSISRTCGVNPYAIAQVNGIFPPYYFIYPGQQLTIPGGSTTPPPQATPTTGGTGRTYVVKPGDNLFRIALSYGVSLQALAAANGITNYNLIFVGRSLIIP